MYLAGQVYPENILVLYNAYLDATQEAQRYLVLYLTQSTNDGLRFRTHIFPNEIHPLTVYSYVGAEAGEYELSHCADAEDVRPKIA